MLPNQPHCLRVSRTSTCFVHLAILLICSTASFRHSPCVYCCSGNVRSCGTQDPPPAWETVGGRGGAERPDKAERSRDISRGRAWARQRQPDRPRHWKAAGSLDYDMHTEHPGTDTWWLRNYCLQTPGSWTPGEKAGQVGLMRNPSS
jgi:hypothetical protein